MSSSAIKLVGALSALTVSGVMGQTSCVQVNSATFSSCPCSDATLTFTLEGTTTVEANTVNLALVLDGSSSIDGADFVLEQQFAVDTVTAFATRNLFDNGGMASYVQYASSLVASGMFDSVEGFTDFSDADVQSGGVTRTNLGIDEGTALLGATDATAAFMIVITDGGSTDPAATIIAADAARAAGIMLFAVGVGTGPDQDELVAIAGDDANVFTVDGFDLLDASARKRFSTTRSTAVKNMLNSSGASTQTVSTPNPTSPTMAPTPCPTMKEPKRGHGLGKGSAGNSKYLGCYKNGPRYNQLDGHRSSSPNMTAQMCADTYSSKKFEYFGTAASSECFCGDSQPTKKGGTCDYECSGNSSKACGGVNCMSIYKFKNYSGK